MIDQYIQQHGKRLYGLCLSLCADKTEAEDLYQETWLRALKHLDQYDREKPFEPWLTKICVNTYRNFLRRMARSPLFSFKSNEEKDAMLNAIPAPEREDHRQLYAAIEKLPEKYRLTVVLYYFREMDVAATAQVLGVPEGTVKSRLSKARQLLKEVLQNEADLRF